MRKLTDEEVAAINSPEGQQRMKLIDTAFNCYLLAYRLRDLPKSTRSILRSAFNAGGLFEASIEEYANAMQEVQDAQSKHLN